MDTGGASIGGNGRGGNEEGGNCDMAMGAMKGNEGGKYVPGVLLLGGPGMREFAFTLLSLKSNMGTEFFGGC